MSLLLRKDGAFDSCVVITIKSPLNNYAATGAEGRLGTYNVCVMRGRGNSDVDQFLFGGQHGPTNDTLIVISKKYRAVRNICIQ
jgi:hypothetical protein